MSTAQYDEEFHRSMAASPEPSNSGRTTPLSSPSYTPKVTRGDSGRSPAMSPAVKKVVYSPPARPMVELCEHLLGEIGKSLKVFKPSKSLAMLSSLSSESLKDKGGAEIDVVISGGGMKCYFMTGCHSILSQELDRRGVKIARVSGASAGN